MGSPVPPGPPEFQRHRPDAPPPPRDVDPWESANQYSSGLAVSIAIVVLAALALLAVFYLLLSSHP